MSLNAHSQTQDSYNSVLHTFIKKKTKKKQIQRHWICNSLDIYL